MNLPRLKQWLRYCLLCSQTLGLPTDAQELSAPEPQVKQLDTLVVVGSKTERSIYETPEMVDRIDYQQMDADQVQKLADLFKDIPGLAFASGPRAIAQKPVIRGLGDTRVLISVDGVRQNFNSAHKGRVFIDTELLKAVEVQRGAGSALYGSGAMGGVIAMTTKDAEDFLQGDERFGLRLKLGHQGVNNERLGTGILFGQLQARGRWDYLLSATNRNSDDIHTGEQETLENSAEDNWSGLAKLNWAPTSSQQVKFSRQYSFMYAQVPAQADAFVSATAVLTDRETEVTQDRLAYHYDNPNQSWLKLKTSLYNNKQTIREKRTATSGRLDLIDFDTWGVDIGNQSQYQGGEFYAQRLSYGIEYYEDKMDSTRAGEPNPLFPSAKRQVTGLYLQNEMTLGRLGRWLLTPGLRYDRFENNITEEIASLDNVDNKADRTSPKLGFIYKMTDWINLAFTYAQAFRAPDFQELYISGVHFGANSFQPNPELEAEELTNGFEFGVRIKQNNLLTQGDYLSLKTSFYHNRYKNFIDSLVTATLTQFDNVNQARIQGAELQLGYYLPHWKLDGNLAVSYTMGDNLTDHQPLTGIPGHSAVLRLKKNLFQQQLSLGWRGSFHRRQDRVAEGQPQTPGYGLHELYLSWLPWSTSWFKDLQIHLGVDNLSDRKYRPHLSNLPGPGRNIKFSLIGQF